MLKKMICTYMHCVYVMLNIVFVCQEGHSHQVSEFEEDWEFAETSAANHQPKVDAPSSSSSSVAEDINPLAFASGSCGWPYPFGMPPSFEEAQEATFELEKAMAE
jgi:hypothetical protein